MRISVVNLTKTLDDLRVHAALRAINRQIECDFSPYWHLHGTLRLDGIKGKCPELRAGESFRGDAMIYLVQSTGDEGEYFGYHQLNLRGVPFAFVYIDLAAALAESWSVALSHEALEMLADPEINRLVQGPHPGDRRRQVFHWLEVCDAVQGQTYELDGVELANFVLPLYFTRCEEKNSRNDFLGRHPLASFGVSEGGYIGFYDPKRRCNATYSADDDLVGLNRAKLKGALQANRRALRSR